MTVDDIIGDISSILANDGSANYIQLTEQTTFFQTISETLLGIIVVLIVAILPLIVALETMYINLPILQERINNTNESGSKFIKRMNEIVFRDARLALTRANAIVTGRSANLEYLRIKLKTIIIAIITISFAMGLGPAVISIIINITQGIIKGFRSVI